MAALWKRQTKPTLMIAAGGTGGHILAGVAIADAWGEETGSSGNVVFIGAKGGLEEKLVPRAGYPLEVFPMGSLKRVSLRRRFKTVFQIPWSFFRSIWFLLTYRPIAVLGAGGYVSGPVLLMAKLIGFRTGILEQNAVPGFTNRILGRFVDQIFCAFPASFRLEKSVLTGNPVRSAIKPMQPAPRNPFTIFVFGGSQGAMGINTLVLDALIYLEDLKNSLYFIHQTGELDYERVLEGHQKARTNARVEKFIYQMAAAYAEASLLICRAGSSTMAEVAMAGRAAVFIPLPTAADNHQEVNARIFVDAGAALLLSQKKSTGEDLAKLIRNAVSDPTSIDRLEVAVKRFSKPNAARDIARILYSRSLKGINA